MVQVKKFFSCALTAALLVTTNSSSIFAQANQETQSPGIYPTETTLTRGPMPKENRPSVALVLAGGGAKGFAELPIIKLLEELDIPIDMIVGTSIGSIIGGLYSAGYTAEEIVAEFENVDWAPLFSDKAVSPFENQLGTHSIYANSAVINFDKKFKMKMGKGISSGQNVYQLFKSKTLKYPSDISFDELPVPFRAVTCNMLTGEAVILDKGDLAEAMRASMSLPAVFEPFEMDGYYFMDGGLRYNLAINVARDMGYDIIIAIDISQAVRANPEVFDANPSVAILNTITIAQQTATQALLKDADLVISPDISHYGTMDFKKARTIYEEGVTAAQKYREQLVELHKKIYPSDYDSSGALIVKPVTSEKTNSDNFYSSKGYIPVNEIIIHGAMPQDEKFIRKTFAKICGKPFYQDNLNQFLKDLYSLGNYSSIRPKIIRKGSVYAMDLYLKQVNHEGIKVLMNVDMQQTVSSCSTTIFNFGGELQFRGFTGHNSVIGLSGKCLSDYELEAFYLQPLNPYVFVTANAHYFDDRYPSLSIEEITISDFTRYQEFDTDIFLGLRSHFGGTVKLGAFYDAANSIWSTLLYDRYLLNYFLFSSTEPSLLEPVRDHCFGPEIQYALHLTDRAAFSHEGFSIEAKTKLLFPVSSPSDFSVISDCNTELAIPLGKKASLNMYGFLGTDFCERLDKSPALYFSEGFMDYNRVFFPQIADRRRHGQHALIGMLALQLEPWDSLTIMGGKIVLRVQGSVGNVTRTWQQMFEPRGDDYSWYRLLWNSCAGIGLILKNEFTILLRAGFGSSNNTEFAPFFAIDIGSIKF